MAFNSHLLNLEEVWFIREHPFDVKAVKVKKLATEINSLEDLLEQKRQELDTAVEDMHTRMKK
jgi:hypothetical protein